MHKDLENYCQMISLPIDENKIADSLLIVYENIEKYRELAKKGNSYVTKNNMHKNMIENLTNILSSCKKSQTLKF